MASIEITYRNEHPFEAPADLFIEAIDKLWENIENNPDMNTFVIELNQSYFKTKYGMNDLTIFGSFDLGSPPIAIMLCGQSEPNFTMNIQTFIEVTQNLTLYLRRIQDNQKLYLKISDTKMGYGILDIEKQKLSAN